MKKNWIDIINEAQNIVVNPLDGLTKAKVKNMIYKKISPLLKGLYRDEYWTPKTKVLNYFNNENFNW